MSNKIILRLVVVFGVLALLLMFLGVNYVPRISALSSAKENAVDAAKNTGSDYIEQHPLIVAKPVNYAGSDWIERHPSIVAKPVNYAGAEVAGTDVKIAPVFDVTGAVVSDPTGTLLSANHSVDMAVPVTGADMKIAPMFDVTGAVVSDPTGTILGVINSGDRAVPVTRRR